jgi:hypothetical protein
MALSERHAKQTPKARALPRLITPSFEKLDRP